MPDYPYQLTLVMPNAVQAWPEDNVSLAAWINTGEPDTVPDDLGPTLNASGAGEPWAHWASSAATEAGMRRIADHLAELCPGYLTVPAAGWWDAATLAEKLAWVNTDLDNAMRGKFSGGVRLEDSATNTNPAALLEEMELRPIQPSRPPHPSESVVWRVRADLGVTGDPSGTGSPPAADGDPVGYWEDLGPDKVSARQATGAQKPVWKEDRVNGQPSLLAEGVQYLTTPAPVAHGIDTGAFSVYCVVCFHDLSTPEQVIWSTAVDASPVLIGAGISGSDDRAHFYAQLPGTGITFYTEAVAGTWYYLLLTRRASDDLVRFWVNTHLDGAESPVAGSLPDDEQHLFHFYFGEPTAPMNGEIAEFGLIARCVETDGEKTALDNYIYERYSLS